MTTSLRIPLRLEQMLAQYCADTGQSKSAVILGLLEQRFNAGSTEKTAYELACETGFLGSFECAEAPIESVARNAKAAVKARIANKHQRPVTL